MTELYTSFVRAVEKYPVLSPEKERTLLSRSLKGDTQARERLVMSNQRLVVSLASKISKENGVSWDLLDFVQEANIALLEAIDQFDLSRGCKLAPWASWVIGCHLRREKLKHGYFARFNFQQLNKRGLEHYENILRPLSIDKYDFEPADEGGGPRVIEFELYIQEIIADAIASLPEKEREMAEDLLDGKSPREITKRFGLTKGVWWPLRRSILTKLRVFLLERGARWMS